MAKQNVGEVASLGDRRSHMTFLASITSDAEVQARLPQVLIGNERQLSAATMRNLTGLPENIHVWRCKSAWNSHALMRRYLSLLASSLGSVLKDRYVILILDVARCHLHPTILPHAKRCGIRLCYIPASMTAELQPCDTHLFARFKGAFQEVWRRQKSISPAGAVSTMQWLHVVVDAIEAVLPTTDWEAAFAASVCFVKFGSAAVSAAHARSVSFSPFSSPILDLPISHCRIGPPCLAVLVLRILLRCLRRCSTYLLWLPGFSFPESCCF